jgi:hypothetical protein
MRLDRVLRVVGMLGALGVGSRALAGVAEERFDHWQHRKLFPSCTGCHAGAADASLALYPSVEDCASCHDGKVEQEVEWTPPSGTRPGNLRFIHEKHAQEVARASAPDSTLSCAACHNEPGGDRMRVSRAVVGNCLSCHGVRSPHLEAPDSACASCHVPLVQAVSLTRERIRRFPTPPSHRDPDFAGATHGKLARAGRTPVAAACATCHARDFCTECHVNAPEVPAIQALAPDPRSLAHEAELQAPPSHHTPEFMQRHGGQARKNTAACVTCHTQESCLACHVGSPGNVQAVPASGPGRGKGAAITRRRPQSHGLDFSEVHAQPAAARPQSCAGCHALSECLSCHRPDPADASPGYHPAGFLTTHPSAAYSRESSCADCHNQAQFCASCHVNAGLRSNNGLRGRGYHDAKRQFLLNHGQAARQELESCVTCHSDRDCLVCHSAQGGRRFNPHGPGFDPQTLRRKSPSMCSTCHGAAIPVR